MRNYAMRNDTSETAIIQDDLKPCVSPEKSGSTDNNAMRNSYAMRTQSVTASGKIANCVHCGKAFERRTTWHKYCEEFCKIQAYELRTGKKWHGKKVRS